MTGIARVAPSKRTEYDVNLFVDGKKRPEPVLGLNYDLNLIRLAWVRLKQEPIRTGNKLTVLIKTKSDKINSWLS